MPPPLYSYFTNLMQNCGAQDITLIQDQTSIPSTKKRRRQTKPENSTALRNEAQPPTLPFRKASVDKLSTIATTCRTAPTCPTRKASYDQLSIFAATKRRSPTKLDSLKDFFDEIKSTSTKEKRGNRGELEEIDGSSRTCQNQNDLITPLEDIIEDVEKMLVSNVLSPKSDRWSTRSLN